MATPSAKARRASVQMEKAKSLLFPSSASFVIWSKGKEYRKQGDETLTWDKLGEYTDYTL